MAAMPAIIQPMGVVRMATPSLRKPRDSPLSRISRGPPMVSIMPRPILMAAMGPSRPASTNSRPPPTAAATAVMAATLAMVAVSSGFLRIHSPTPRVMAVICWIRPRSGPFWEVISSMLRSCHAEVKPSMSPRALSAMTRATSAASPVAPYTLSLNARTLSAPFFEAATSGIMALSASCPDIAAR